MYDEIRQMLTSLGISSSQEVNDYIEHCEVWGLDILQRDTLMITEDFLWYLKSCRATEAAL